MSRHHSPLQPSPSPSNRGERRLLRVGIVHGRRIVEERLLARAGDVTIGTSPRSTFIVPWDDAPPRWRLFEERGGRRFLRLPGDMSARIAEGAAVTSVDARGAGDPAAADSAVRPGARQGDRRRHDRAVPAAAPAAAAAAPAASALRSPAGHRRDRSPCSRSSSRSRCCCTWRSSSTCGRSTGRGARRSRRSPIAIVRQIVRTPRPTPPPAAPTTVAVQEPNAAAARAAPARARADRRRRRTRRQSHRRTYQPRSRGSACIPLLTARAPTAARRSPTCCPTARSTVRSTRRCAA